MKNARIGDAKRVQEALGARGVIVLAFDEDGAVAGASYAETREECRALGALLDELVDGIGDGTVGRSFPAMWDAR